MGGNTGIQNRKEYLQRLLKEDKRMGDKDEAYAKYLSSLSVLLIMTNDIYKEKKGKLDKKSYQDLVNQYLDVAQKGNEYKEKAKEAKKLREEYEAKYGPITATSSSSKTPWQWIQNPWVWERSNN